MKRLGPGGGVGGEHQEEPLPLTFGGGGVCSEKTSEADTLVFQGSPVIGLEMFPQEIVNKI